MRGCWQKFMASNTSLSFHPGSKNWRGQRQKQSVLLAFPMSPVINLEVLSSLNASLSLFLPFNLPFIPNNGLLHISTAANKGMCATGELWLRCILSLSCLYHLMRQDESFTRWKPLLSAVNLFMNLQVSGVFTCGLVSTGIAVEHVKDASNGAWRRRVQQVRVIRE